MGPRYRIDALNRAYFCWTFKECNAVIAALTAQQVSWTFNTLIEGLD